MTRHDLGVSIRAAVDTDNILLARLGAETFYDTFVAYNTREDMSLYLQGAFGPEIQTAEIAEPSALFLIAEVAGEPAGYVHLREGSPATRLGADRPVEIVRLYARARWIGRGVGAALMQAALREAGARGCDAIWLGAC
jgi:GNAT superfamily N-acetyltransferase